MSALAIDHVTVAASDLDRLADCLDELDLSPEYGGPHSNGATHMSVLGFPDGSYVELVSTLPDAERSPLWDAHIRGDAGPCAWAVRATNIDAEADRLRDRGVPVEGPTPLGRERPDGTPVEWDLAFLGGGDPGATLPFLIEDRTPRERRVTPSPSVEATDLTGVETVVLAVPDVGDATETFRRAFDLAEPKSTETGAFDARIVRFPDAPVALAEPPAETSPLADRLASVGPSPCAFLLGSDDPETDRDRFCADERFDWGEETVGWLDADCPELARIGVVG